MRTGHLLERAEIALVLSMVFEADTNWHTHGELVQICREVIDYSVHDDCVRLVCKGMVKDGKAEIAVKNGNYLYRTPTALWMGGMVSSTKARKRPK